MALHKVQRGRRYSYAARLGIGAHAGGCVHCIAAKVILETLLPDDARDGVARVDANLARKRDAREIDRG